MSELKAFNMPRYAGAFTMHEVYLKSEADKVIAELKECAKNLILDNYLKDKEIKHHKYKRCLAMARWCESKVYHIRRTPLCDIDEHEGWQHDDEFWQRWHKRWLELAEKFKEWKCLEKAEEYK